MRKAKQLSALFFCIICFAANSLPAVAAQKKAMPLTILTYHHILKDEENVNFRTNACVISAEEFEKEMSYLHENGFNTITQNELYEYLYNKANLPQKSVMITFDDGYLSNIRYAYPILKKYGFHATIFYVGVNVNEIDKEFDPNALTRISLRDMAETRDVFDFAHHTYAMHHYENDAPVLTTASQEAILEDLRKNTFEFTYTTAFAYPYGRYNDNVIEALKLGGIKMCFTVKDEYVTKDTNPYEIGRFTMYPNCYNRFLNAVNHI